VTETASWCTCNVNRTHQSTIHNARDVSDKPVDHIPCIQAKRKQLEINVNTAGTPNIIQQLANYFVKHLTKVTK